ncbi:MAG: tyrosine-type recombinase/integrase [Pseudomonadota bacterium]
MDNKKTAPIAPLFETIDSCNFTSLENILTKSPGYNQSGEPNMLGANSDAQAINTFLRDYRTAKLTYRSYLKEIERLLLWCLHGQKVGLSDLKRDHIIAYREFLSDPQPKEVWCGPRKPRTLPCGTPNPQWRPFAAPLSPPSVRKTLSILDSFFSYLVQNNYFAGNPMAVDKRRKGKKSNSTDRWLERDEIITTLEALDELAHNLYEWKFEVIRAKYIILTLFYTGLRLAELTHHTMGDFILIEDAWYLKVIGKGEKERKIPVVDEYLDVVAQFRRALGLSPLPQFGEKTPLVPALETEEALSDSRVWQILKWAFSKGANRYEYLDAKHNEEKQKNFHKASKLRKASTHWLRHSYGTYLVRAGCPIEKVKELMGHSDISTTMIYVHIAKSDLHTSANNLSLHKDLENDVEEDEDN